MFYYIWEEASWRRQPHDGTLHETINEASRGRHLRGDIWKETFEEKLLGVGSWEFPW